MPRVSVHNLTHYFKLSIISGNFFSKSTVSPTTTSSSGLGLTIRVPICSYKGKGQGGVDIDAATVKDRGEHTKEAATVSGVA